MCVCVYRRTNSWDCLGRRVVRPMNLAISIHSVCYFFDKIDHKKAATLRPHQVAVHFCLNLISNTHHRMFSLRL